MTNNLSLSDFIRSNIAAITREWAAFARTLTPAADHMTHLGLQDHIEEILGFIADDIESLQSRQEQKDKSQGSGDKRDHHTIGAIHGSLRFEDGFDLVQMISEYRALRASIIKLWTQMKTMLSGDDVLDLTRFNESIDQLVAESLRRFMEKLDYSRNLVFGVMGHDIRNPLGAIRMSAQLLQRAGDLDEKQTRLAAQIGSSSLRISQIVTDLLDLTRAQAGTPLPVRRAAMDIGALAVQLVTELRAQYPDADIKLEKTGNAEGEWDFIRMGQVFSNLIGNAVQYSPKGSPINVVVKGDAQSVVVSVHNEGTPIPPRSISTIFSSFVRVANVDAEQRAQHLTNVGLGLFIVKEIVKSHGGTIRADITGYGAGLLQGIERPQMGQREQSRHPRNTNRRVRPAR